MENLFDFGKNTNFWSRALALKTRDLVDLTDNRFSEIVNRFGFPFPIAMTSRAFTETVAPDDTQPEPLTQEKLRTVLRYLKMSVQDGTYRWNKSLPQCVMDFAIPGTKEEDYKPTSLKLMLSPGDNGEPVLTILLSGEEQNVPFHFVEEYK